MQFVKTLPGKELCPGFVTRLVHGAQSTVSFVDITKGSKLPEHHHVHEQITYIVEGELEMVIGGEVCLLKKGMVHVIPSGVPHSATAHADCKVIDFFSPARDDYR
ncbi:MAG TPA: cupin domain-containing protein [Chitinophagaceae bacterium]|nr:cupin domain-containing protein [Chitinophagaceae bacterium]